MLLISLSTWSNWWPRSRCLWEVPKRFYVLQRLSQWICIVIQFLKMNYWEFIPGNIWQYRSFEITTFATHKISWAPPTGTVNEDQRNCEWREHELPSGTRILSDSTQYFCGQPISLSWLWGRKIVVLTSCFGSLFLRNSGEKEVLERVRLNQEFDF